MRYQIYLTKEISNFVEACAKATNTKPCTFLKTYIEECFQTAIDAVDPNNLIEKFGETLTNGTRKR